MIELSTVRMMEELAAELDLPFFTNVNWVSIYHRPVITERERNCIDDKAFKTAPKRELMNAQYRLRESGRCGRMRR